MPRSNLTKPTVFSPTDPELPCLVGFRGSSEHRANFTSGDREDEESFRGMHVEGFVGIPVELAPKLGPKPKRWNAPVQCSFLRRELLLAAGLRKSAAGHH